MKKSPNLLTVSGKLLLLGDFLSYGDVRPVFRVRARFPLNSDDWRLRRQTIGSKVKGSSVMCRSMGCLIGLTISLTTGD